MSIAPESPPPQLPPTQRSGCLTAFMVVAGLILLLPGLCAMFFGANELTSTGSEPVVTVLVDRTRLGLPRHLADMEGHPRKPVVSGCYYSQGRWAAVSQMTVLRPARPRIGAKFS